VIIREAHTDDIAGIAKVHVDSWQTTYAGLAPDEYLANMTYSSHEKWWMYNLTNNSEGSFTYIAEDDSGQIIGFVSGGPERTDDTIYKGELYAIYILKAYQGQGIGRLLIETLVKRLLKDNMKTMLLSVLAHNPACRFYEALGGNLVRTAQFEIGGLMLDEVAYGWMDIRKLLQD
jgi:ribosomal protein S18 acetylase RimI-like enzyme